MVVAASLAKVLRWVGWVAGGLFAVGFALTVLAGGLLLGANTEAGRAFMGRAISGLTGGQVRVSGFAGHFPDDFRVGRLELADEGGSWLRAENLALRWSPRRLLAGELAVQSLSAGRVTLARLPADGAAGSGSGSFALPLPVRVERLLVGRIEIAKPVIGIAAAFTLDGHADVPSLERAAGALSLRRLEKPGEYRLDARQDGAGLHARLSVSEQDDGLLAAIAGIPELGPVSADATADGPAEALASRVVLDAGPLHAEADGTIQLVRQTGDMVVVVNDIAPLAAFAGLDLQGATRLNVHVGLSGPVTHLAADGTLALTGGPARLPVLIGRDAKLHVEAELRGDNIGLTRFSLAGEAATASAKGSLTGDTLALDWTIGLPKLPVLVPTLDGALEVAGRLSGPLTDLAASADVSGTVVPAGVPGGAIKAHVEAHGLPDAPNGTVIATGEFAGAPLDVALELASHADGSLQGKIQRAVWRSAQATGTLSLPAGTQVPLGRIDLKMDRLSDLAPLLGRPLSGAVTATLDSTPQRASLNLEARGAGFPGAGAAGMVKLSASIPDPARPVADVKLSADAVRVTGIPDPIGLTANGQVDILARQATIAALNASWNREQLRLLNPVRVSFASAIEIDRLRLGLRQAVLEASGRVSPALDLTASLRGVTPEVAALFVPGLEGDGTLRADARLTGSPARPSGTVRVEATGLRPHSGPARGLPAGQLNVTATLADGRASIDARLTAGTASLTVNGTAPVGAGPIDLRADGSVNLAMLEPLVSAAGRRIGGQASLRANLRGTMAEPRLEGQVGLSNGLIQDYTTGLHLTAIAATLHGDGNTLRIDTFTGRAGPNQGRVDLAGSIGILAPGMPIDLTLTARNARPLSNDLLTATLDADLALRGQAASELTLSGTIKLLRADIRVPERLPASIPVLNVIRPGAKPAPPPSPGPDIRLGVTLNAPREIFVRGRGLDAELGGIVHLTGTLANPLPDGRFQLRRGDFSLAGQTITFTKGEIGFDGGSLTDPSLNFLASRTGNSVTANLAVTGSASKPKITLSSSPPLPQDEILSELLLGRSAATLQPLELAQIATALASLTGATPGFDPLNTVRTELGLDRLSIGNNGGGGSTLDAGRYIAPGIYIGARQSLTGNGTQSVVQIDITKSLKVEGTVGTGTASATGNEASQGTGIAVIYQRDY